jgi:hypothetical protein
MPGQVCTLRQLSKPAPDQARATAKASQLREAAVAGDAAGRDAGQHLKKDRLAFVTCWRVERWRYLPVFHG